MSVLNIQIHEHYAQNDPEFTGECDMELIVDGKSILYGDYYHDKIEYQIMGFFEALGYLGTLYKKKIIKLADSEVW